MGLAQSTLRTALAASLVWLPNDPRISRRRISQYGKTAPGAQKSEKRIRKRHDQVIGQLVRVFNGKMRSFCPVCSGPFCS
jgi:hypothetical protein